MYSGTLTDITGIRVGHYTNTDALTGCTVVLFDDGAVCGVDVRGAAPGTRETDLLRGFNLVEKVNAILLSGGSAYGLSAADGVMRYLEKNEKGVVSLGVTVPIVPAAVIFDLAIGNAAIRPNSENGEEACLNATDDPVLQGRIGVGVGATVGKLLGGLYQARGGVGSASIRLPNNIIVSALIAVNSAGDVYDHRSGRIIAGANKNGEFLNCLDHLLQGNDERPEIGSNTTIGVIATNARLTREQSNRLATIAHDGLAMAVRPVHTQFDGDTLFGASTCEIDVPFDMLLQIFAAASEVTARAVANAVRASEEV